MTVRISHMIINSSVLEIEDLSQTNSESLSHGDNMDLNQPSSFQNWRYIQIEAVNEELLIFYTWLSMIGQSH